MERRESLSSYYLGRLVSVHNINNSDDDKKNLSKPGYECNVRVCDPARMIDRRCGFLRVLNVVTCH